MPVVAKKGIKVWLLIVDHDHGQNIDVFFSKAAAERELRNFVEMYWDVEMGSKLPPSDKNEMVKQYFSADHGESYQIEGVVVK